MPKFEDLTGLTFDRLYVIKRVENKSNRPYWLCRCKCGNEKIINGYSLKAKKTRSCGCYKMERKRDTNKIHNSCYTRLYGVWNEMRQRCYNKNCCSYKNYGAIGIGVDETIWIYKNGFIDFKEWAYKNGYREEILPNGKNKWTLDRIDNSKGYSKENCRWVTFEEQQNNRRNNHLITYNNETHTITEWAKKINMRVETLHERLYRYKWSIEKAFTTPVKIYKRKLEKKSNE